MDPGGERAMEYLLEGVRDFTGHDFLQFKELFSTLEKQQQPHSLFITCSDSRIVPTMITKTLPGELFIIRNVANLVPYHHDSEEFLATTSAIEYAVQVLNVENIIVCGHSNCGGCNALYAPEEQLERVPHTRKWLELARPVKDMVERDPALLEDIVKREWVTEQLNVVEQRKHLLTYPYIAQRVDEGKLNIYGWYYMIGTGEVFNYNEQEHRFVLI